jgi:hypothetical protein
VSVQVHWAMIEISPSFFFSFSQRPRGGYYRAPLTSSSPSSSTKATHTRREVSTHTHGVGCTKRSLLFSCIYTLVKGALSSLSLCTLLSLIPSPMMSSSSSRSSTSRLLRVVVLVSFFLLPFACCHALTVDEGEQQVVTMVMDKIEQAAAAHHAEYDDPHQRDLQATDPMVGVSVAVGCIAQWETLMTIQDTFTNNTAIYLCDGMNDALVANGAPTLIIPAGMDVTISCLGICTVPGGGTAVGGPGGGGGGAAFVVQAGGRLDLFGIDFENINGVSCLHARIALPVACLFVCLFVCFTFQTPQLYPVEFSLSLSWSCCLFRCAETTSNNSCLFFALLFSLFFSSSLSFCDTLLSPYIHKYTHTASGDRLGTECLFRSRLVLVYDKWSCNLGWCKYFFVG